MKIYFAGSIRGGRDHLETYHHIISLLKNYGEVLTEFIASKELTSYGTPDMTDKEIHDKDIKWLLSADVIVADISQPSLGVGYELGRAYENKKKVLCLYKEQEGKRGSAMIKGQVTFINKNYNTKEDIKQILEEFFK